MRREIIFTGSTKEDVAQKFAEIVVESYVRALLAYQQVMQDDIDEYRRADYKLKTLPNQLRDTAKVRMKKIMEDPFQYSRFYVRYGFFRSLNLICIKPGSDFYLGTGDNQFHKTVPLNVIYFINKRRRTIEVLHFNPKKERVDP